MCIRDSFKGDSFSAALSSKYFTCTFPFFARSSIPLVISSLLGSSSFKETTMTVSTAPLFAEDLVLFCKRACRPQPVIVKLRDKEIITNRYRNLFDMRHTPLEAQS